MSRIYTNDVEGTHGWDSPDFWPAMRKKANDPKYLGTTLDHWDRDRKEAAAAVAQALILGVLDQLAQALALGLPHGNAKPVCGLPLPSRRMADEAKKQVKRRFRKKMSGEIRSCFEPYAAVKKLDDVRGYDWHVVVFEMNPIPGKPLILEDKGE